MEEKSSKQDEKNLTYAGSGIPYSAFDPFKQKALEEAAKTAGNIKDIELEEIAESRGESVHLIELPEEDCIIAHVNESLGTKILVADAMYKLTGRSDYYHKVGQCGFAMIINDLVTLGARAISANMFLGAGNASWFEDKARYTNLLKGWKHGCDLAGCVWGGGETPVLPDIINPETIVLAGSAVGIIKPKSRLIRPNVQDGDAIIFLESSGPHSNGYSLARKIGKKLPEGYLSELKDGSTYGDALLVATLIYAKVIEECLYNKIDIHYTVNITGHGWRKLARFPEPFVYVIEKIPSPHPVFDFIQIHGPVDEEEMYKTFNMDAGYAIFVPKKQANKVIRVAEGKNIKAIEAGYVEKRGNEKKVIILPKGLELNPAEIR